MHRTRITLQAAFYDYPIGDLYSLVYNEKNRTGAKFLYALGQTIGVRDENANQAVSGMEVTRLGNRGGNVMGNCFEVAAEFARDVLAIAADGLLKVKFEHLLKWRALTRLTGEDLLTIAYLAKTDQQNRTDFCWHDVMDTDCPWLEDILKEGVCDIHSHLNASFDAFQLNWIGLMNQIKGRNELFDQLEHPKDNPVVLRDFQFSDLYTWCVLAAKIRCCLYETIVEGTMSEDRFLDLMDDYSNLRNITYYNTLVENVEESILTQRYMARRRYQTNDLLDYAVDLGQDGSLLNSPFSVLSGERRLLYSVLRKYFNRQIRHSEIIQFVYLYERIKVEVRKELVQTNSKTGLVNFKLYNGTKDTFSRRDERLMEVMRLYGIQSSLEKPNTLLEGRFCMHEADTFLGLDYDKGIHGGNVLGKYRDRLRCVIHLTKRKVYSGERRGQKIREKWLKEINQALISQQRNPSIVGIDFAGSELYTRPEMAGHSIRYARAHGLTNITYHVGEDYYDLADGLRAVDEIIRYGEMDEHSRLGHALAMGINARNYYKQNDYEMVLPKQYRLDNLVWMIKRSKEWRLHLDQTLEESMVEESGKLYREIGYPRVFNLDDYYASMMLRSDDDMDYVDDWAGLQDCENKWNRTMLLQFREGTDYRTIERACRLYNLYLEDSIYQKGNIPIKVRVTNDYIKQIIRLQKAVGRLVVKKGICVEYNPTSNVLISNMKRYDAHPVSKNRKSKGIAKMKVALGTDDKGVFATSLYNEYALLAAAMMKKKRRMGYPEWYDKHVAEYLKEIADASLQNRF